MMGKERGEGEEGRESREQKAGTAKGFRVQEAGFRVQVLPRGRDLARCAVPAFCFLLSALCSLLSPFFPLPPLPP
ncbi:MAG TPA: hypothetical protein VFR95_03830, partial [Gemmatimonadaceae bacterium]|nr:hypothetical protein [Gemmatimonadaceae bacterium]